MTHTRIGLTTFTFRPPNPSIGRVCVIHNAVCTDHQLRRIEIRPTLTNVVITTLILIIISLVGFFIFDIIMDTTFHPSRLVTVSYISGIIGILAVLYNIPIFRAMFLAIIPIIVIYYPLLIYLNDIYGTSLAIEAPPFSFTITTITHLPHFVCAIILLMDRSPLDYRLFGVAVVFWAAELVTAYVIFPELRMFYYLDFTQTIIIVESSAVIALGVAWFMGRKGRGGLLV